MLWQSYSWHVRHNSSQQIAAIEKAEVVTSSVLLPLMQAAAATILVVLVSVLLLSIAPLVTVAAGVGLGLAYYAISRFGATAPHCLLARDWCGLRNPRARRSGGSQRNSRHHP